MAQSTQGQVVNLFLVAENRLFRQMLIRLFRKRSDMSIVGEGCYSESVAKAIASSQCDVLLLDALTTHNSTDLTFRVLESAPQIKVVMFGMEEDSDDFVKAVRSGVSGYVLKDASAAQLISAVRGVMQGEAACPAKLCMTLFQLVAHEHQQIGRVSDQVVSRKPGLTHRQRQLAGLVAMGKTNKEIAANLNLSEFTVKNHIRRIMRSVDAHTRYDAVDSLRATGSLPTA
jgi:two-component system, NarL family, nitrate/nitrite response regulator NarL